MLFFIVILENHHQSISFLHNHPPPVDHLATPRNLSSPASHQCNAPRDLSCGAWGWGAGGASGQTTHFFVGRNVGPEPIVIQTCYKWSLQVGPKSPFPVIVTTRIISCLVGNPYKPSFATITGKGDNPRYTQVNLEAVCVQSSGLRLLYKYGPGPVWYIQTLSIYILQLCGGRVEKSSATLRRSKSI